MKPIVIFTTFFDANWVIGQGKFLAETDFGVTLVKLSRYEVFSIATSHPSLTRLQNIRSMRNLSFLSPDYEWVHDYHIDKDWAKYKRKYILRLKYVKNEVILFLSELKNDTVYFLCCWEDTTKHPHCHRQIIFDACTKSETVRDKAMYIYRDGSQAPGKRISVHLSDSIWGAIDPEIASITDTTKVQYMMPGKNVFQRGCPIHNQNGTIIGFVVSSTFEKSRNRTLITIQLDQSQEAKKISEQTKEPNYVTSEDIRV